MHEIGLCRINSCFPRFLKLVSDSCALVSPRAYPRIRKPMLFVFNMKSLKTVPDSELLSEARSLVSEERRLGIEILHRLREIELRQLHVKEGYPSLHEFAVRSLSYSDGAAHRRIQAMRLLRNVPEAEESLKTGELTLTNASQLEDFFRAEKKLGKAYAPAEKLSLLKELQGKSTRQAQAALMERSPEAVPRETLKPIGQSESKLTLVVSRELEEKLKRLQGLLAHRLPGASYAELLDAMADLALQKLDPGLQRGRSVKTESSERTPAAERSRVIPAHVRRLVWRKAQGQCEHRVSGVRCSSRYALQIDHVHPFGKGGPSIFENLQLLCRAEEGRKSRGLDGFPNKCQLP